MLFRSFCLYLVATMARFASLSLILSAAGRTKALMVVSLVAVVFNALLCVVLYSIMGFVGPALASVLVNVGMAAVLVRLSLKEVGGSLATDRRLQVGHSIVIAKFVKLREEIPLREVPLRLRKRSPSKIGRASCRERV